MFVCVCVICKSTNVSVLFVWRCVYIGMNIYLCQYTNLG